MAKQIKYGVDARKAPSRRKSVSRHSSCNLGPERKKRCSDKSFGAPLITNDGVTIAKEIELEDPYENTGAQLVGKLQQRPMT